MTTWQPARFAAVGGPRALIRRLDPRHPLIVATATVLDDPPAEPIVGDVQGRTYSKYAASPGTVYLIRPDLHVCARWRQANPTEVVQALRHATGFAEGCGLS